jgi:hypothetical protein
MAELKREHARLVLLNEQLTVLTQAEMPVDQPIAATIAQRHDLLCRLRGIGPAIAATLAHEVFYKDFRNRREVGSYVGLCPSPWRSGGIAREQGISKAGNPRARTTAIELAWLWVLHQPDSELSQEFRQRTSTASKRVKRIAIVALARKLMVALWRYLTTGLVPGPQAGRITVNGHDAAGHIRGQCSGMDGDRATLGPIKSRFRRWVPSSWLLRRMHAEFGYGRSKGSERTGYEVMP